jgi:hypothetical protein
MTAATTTTPTLGDIEKNAKTYADARAKLADVVAELNEGIDALKKQHLPAVRRALNRAAEHHEALRAMIDAAPELFVKPRTLVLHGVKLGYQKGKGGISFEDPARVVQLIRKHLPEQADVLIATKEAPAKDALANLPVADLKRLGCSVVDAGDTIVIKPTDSEVDKMVDALLKDATTTEAEGS